ncbi:hypothetical protein T12_11127 [Trichinella patagoniensis]|uniref:Uncharacterized protein n=1 Tax=Trichinella patagoniensis TaxID=990121 RepID=A0A0V0WBJ4_9BILA|nr:hypothetical protein T12_11127 [Trichinella patagoniensis]
MFYHLPTQKSDVADLVEFLPYPVFCLLHSLLYQMVLLPR